MAFINIAFIYKSDLYPTNCFHKTRFWFIKATQQLSEQSHIYIIQHIRQVKPRLIRIITYDCVTPVINEFFSRHLLRDRPVAMSVFITFYNDFIVREAQVYPIRSNLKLTRHGASAAIRIFNKPDCLTFDTHWEFDNLYLLWCCNKVFDSEIKWVLEEFICFFREHINNSVMSAMFVRFTISRDWIFDIMDILLVVLLQVSY